ncbi:hypothetical protein WJX72_004661 [[Myrmecia] bisecta]|uniref:Fe2OG dioxygenase domain-containing protein n=1 Tax=[Myrmecia] bisecta TaxID=41462 RepID=A0AAW1QQF9_9CHLO
MGDFDKRKEQITEELMRAATDIGFFQVVNHGISQAEMDQAFAVGHRFLELPTDVKRKRPVDKSNFAYILGYSTEDLSVGTLREAMFCGFDNARMSQLWPAEEDCPHFKRDTLAWMHRCHEVTSRIMSCFATGLGLPEDYFEAALDPAAPDNQTAMFYNHYPSVEGKLFPEGALRIAAHTDFELLTLLFQRPGQAGLEVCPGIAAGVSLDKRPWTPIDPIPGAITINIGDALQYWSDDRLKSTFHRVRMPRPEEYKGPRRSIAYFANARASTILQGPLKKYPEITFPEILAQKAAYREKHFDGKDFDDMTDEEKIQLHGKLALGPEFSPVDVEGEFPATRAAVPDKPALQFLSQIRKIAPIAG